jgi:hypothetical protein
VVGLLAHIPTGGLVQSKGRQCSVFVQVTRTEIVMSIVTPAVVAAVGSGIFSCCSLQLDVAAARAHICNTHKVTSATKARSCFLLHAPSCACANLDLDLLDFEVQLGLGFDLDLDFEVHLK